MVGRDVSVRRQASGIRRLLVLPEPWRSGDPVSEWERHRNAAIYARQGNRNPFIDHPEWAVGVVPALREGTG